MSGPTRTLLSSAELDTLVRRLGREISRDHPDGVVLVGVLRSSLCFVADLARHLSVDSNIDFVALSAFAPGEPRVRVLMDLEIDVTGRDVVLLEPLVDTGLSTQFLLGLLRQRRPRTVRVCALLERPQRRILPFELNYVGAVAPEDFLVGYGLDFAGRYRNLPSIEVVDPLELERDPEFFEMTCYSARG